MWTDKVDFETAHFGISMTWRFQNGNALVCTFFFYNTVAVHTFCDCPINSFTIWRFPFEHALCNGATILSSNINVFILFQKLTNCYWIRLIACAQKEGLSGLTNIIFGIRGDFSSKKLVNYDKTNCASMAIYTCNVQQSPTIFIMNIANGWVCEAYEAQII